MKWITAAIAVTKLKVVKIQECSVVQMMLLNAFTGNTLATFTQIAPGC